MGTSAKRLTVVLVLIAVGFVGCGGADSPTATGAGGEAASSEKFSEVKTSWAWSFDTLAEMTATSTAVVVATVKGEAWVESSTGDQARQLSFSVDEQWMGDQIETFDWFDLSSKYGDEKTIAKVSHVPWLEVGDSALMFLFENPEQAGQYNIVAPEGIYPLNGDKLTSVAEGSLAEGFASNSLQAAKAEFEKALAAVVSGEVKARELPGSEGERILASLGATVDITSLKGSSGTVYYLRAARGEGGFCFAISSDPRNEPDQCVPLADDLDLTATGPLWTFAGTEPDRLVVGMAAEGTEVSVEADEVALTPVAGLLPSELAAPGVEYFLADVPVDAGVDVVAK